MAYKLVLVLGLLILLAACGGDSGPTQDALKSRGETVADAINDGKWAKVYTLFSPESKAVCDGAEFAVAFILTVVSHLVMGIVITRKEINAM